MDFESFFDFFVFHYGAQWFQVFLLEIYRFFQVVLSYILMVEFFPLKMVNILQSLHLLVQVVLHAT